MSMFDKAKDFAEKNAGKAKEFAEKNSEKISEGIDKASRTIDEKTDGKYRDQVSKFGDTAKEKLRGASDRGDTTDES